MTRAVLMLASVLVAGCAALKQADTPVTMRLSPAPPGNRGAAPPDPRTIAVAPVMARGVTGQLRYTYVVADQPAVLQQARTMFWEESPTHALERALGASLRTRFANVIEPGLPGTADARLIARLDHFEEIGAGGRAQAQVSVWVTLTGAHPAVGSYCLTSPIQGVAPSERAAAFDLALGRVADLVAQDAAIGSLRAVTC